MKPLIINALFALCIFQVSGQNSPPPAPGPEACFLKGHTNHF